MKLTTQIMIIVSALISLIGCSIFTKSDSVVVFDLSGNLEKEFMVGVLPGDIISVTE